MLLSGSIYCTFACDYRVRTMFSLSPIQILLQVTWITQVVESKHPHYVRLQIKDIYFGRNMTFNQTYVSHYSDFQHTSLIPCCQSRMITLKIYFTVDAQWPLNWFKHHISFLPFSNPHVYCNRYPMYYNPGATVHPNFHRNVTSKVEMKR